MDKKKICMVGQGHYFRCLVEHDLDHDYDVQWYQVSMTLDKEEAQRRYKGLLDVDADVMFFFRGEFVPRNILNKITKPIKVQLSSEPLPGRHKATGNTKFVTTQDRISRFEMLKANMNQFDYFFHYDKTSIPFLEANGFNVDGEFIFPVATRMYKDLEFQKSWDVGFFGRSTLYREAMMQTPKRDFKFLHVVHGVVGQEWVNMINRCRIGLNMHVDSLPSLEHRCQNMMACGVLVLSDPLTHNDCLVPGKHFVEYKDPKDLMSKISYYLEHPKEAEAIAKQGRYYVMNHLDARGCWKKMIEGVLK